MRIVSWNCNGAFRKKFKEVIKYNADVYVIQECENTLKTNDNEYKKFASNHIRIGNENKNYKIDY